MDGWMLLGAANVAAFALGFWMGRRHRRRGWNLYDGAEMRRWPGGGR